MLTKFFKKLEDTIKGQDGKYSHRRLSVVYFILLLTYMIIKTASGAIFPEIAWIVVSGGAGLFSGLSIWQQKVNKIKDENITEDIPSRKFNNSNE